ncbi:MAG: Rrf2 family transcriptional regulator, partial [Deltaproteobacteria bacterium]
LKILARGGLLASQRGAQGGYCLARSPQRISMAQVYLALEGPLVVTQGGVRSVPQCSIGRGWTVLNRAVLNALEGISLWDMTVAGRAGDAQR